MPKDLQNRGTVIPDDAKWVRGTQAIDSDRWPMGRDTFYRLVRNGHITKFFPVPGGNPVYSVEQIDQLFEASVKE